MSNYKVIELEQRSPEWHAFRANRVMASDMPKIMGLSPYGSAYSTWLEKNNMHSQKDTMSMAFGRDQEPMILQRINEMTGLQLVPVVVESSLTSYMGASLDGLDIKNKSACEIKCANRADHLIAKTERIPDKYFPQVQDQLYCLDMDWIYYISFHNDEMIYFKEYRDDKFIKKMLKEAEIFWDCLQNFIPPELSEKDYVKNDALELQKNLKLLDELREKKREIEDTEKKVREKILLSCDNKNTLCGEYKISKVITKGSIDYSSIEELKNIDLSKYRKQSRESWRIS